MELSWREITGTGWLTFGVFGLSENECTDISQIDALHILWFNLTNTQVH